MPILVKLSRLSWVIHRAYPTSHGQVIAMQDPSEDMSMLIGKQMDSSEISQRASYTAVATGMSFGMYERIPGRNRDNGVVLACG